MKQFFANRERETDPEVILKKRNRCGGTVFEAGTISGGFWRVRPANIREIEAIQMMEHRYEKHAPASGDGIIVSDIALFKFIK